MTQRTDDRTWREDDPLRDEGNVVPPGRARGTIYAPGHDAVELKNRVQFGPVVAGVLTAIATLLILSVLGLAIGASALEPRDVGESLGFGAAVWGIISALIAFFLGGWVAAKTAAVAGAGSGLINGLMVGAAILALVIWLSGTAAGAILGTLGDNLDDLVNVVDADDATVQEAFNTVEDGAWGTLLGLVLPLAAAAVGGLLGHNKREDVIQSGV